MKLTLSTWGLMVLFFLSGISTLLAEGSRNLYPAGVTGGRTTLFSGIIPSVNMPFPTRGVQYVYAEVGETIALASSAQSGTNNRIRLYGINGTLINLTFASGAGNIPNRTGELGGPRLPNQAAGSDRYLPIYHQVTQSGIYRVELDGTRTSAESITDGRATGILANSSWTQNNNSNYIMAWDVSVANIAKDNWITGRVYSNVLNMDNPLSSFTTTNGFFGKFKVLTRDGYVYNIDNNGQNGLVFTFMVNNRGFYEVGNPDKPSYSSVNASSISDMSHAANRYSDPRVNDVGSVVNQKIFYDFPDSSMPVSAIGAVPGGETWLRVLEKDLAVDVITLEGVEGSSNQLGNKGAYIKFFNESGGDYFIEIRPKTGSSFVPRNMTGSSVVGDNKILWDGKGGDGNALPNGLADVEIELKLRGAEVHFPYIDVEQNVNGIIVELLNTELNGVRSDKVYWNDNIFSTGNVSGAKSDPINASHTVNSAGVSSNSNGHKWGAGGSTTGTFGDTRGMDTWTFIEGATKTVDFEVDISIADLEIPSITPSKTYLTVGDKVTYYIKAKNNGPSDVQSAPFSFIVPAGFDPKSISFNGNGCGTENVALTYNSSTRTYSSTLNLPNQCVVYYSITMDVNAAITAGQHDFTATILRPNDVTDPDATSSDIEVPPTDPFFECTNNGLGGVCNNIKTVSIQYDVLGLCYDLIEGEEFNWNYPSSAQSSISEEITQPGTNAGFVFDIYELDNSFNMEINNVILATQEIEFQKNGGLIQNIRFADGAIWEDGTVEDIWKLLGETGKPIIRVEISSTGAIQMYGSKVSASNVNYALEPLELFGGNTFNTINFNTNSDNVIEITQNVQGATKMLGYGSGQNIVPCDTYTLEKEGVFNDENNDALAQEGETITYVLTVKNAGDLDIYNLKVEDTMLGGVITAMPTGDTNSDGVLNILEEWVYTVVYTITQNDIKNKGVYNLASVSGKNVLNEDLNTATSLDPTPLNQNDPRYDPVRPNHTFVPLKGRSLLITNPMIYQRMKK